MTSSAPNVENDVFARSADTRSNILNDDSNQAGEDPKPEFLGPVSSPFRLQLMGAGTRRSDALGRRSLKPVPLHGLHRIVDCLNLERGDSEIVESGDEDDRPVMVLGECRATTMPSRPGVAMKEEDVGMRGVR